MPRLRNLIILTALSSPLITSCSTEQATSYAANYVTKAALNELGPAGDAISIGMDLEKDVIGFEALVRILIKEARVTWGNEKKASSKEYVKYTNHYRTRVFVDFETGKVHVETLDRNDLRKAIAAILLIGIEQSLTAPLLPHHRPYGSRNTAVQITLCSSCRQFWQPKVLKVLVWQSVS